MSAPTPTPWRHTGFSGTSGSHQIVSESGEWVANLGGPPESPAVVANAELIVRAVNAHQPLVDALRTAETAIRAVFGDGAVHARSLQSDISVALQRAAIDARAALRQAEETTP